MGPSWPSIEHACTNHSASRDREIPRFNVCETLNLVYSVDLELHGKTSAFASVEPVMRSPHTSNPWPCLPYFIPEFPSAWQRGSMYKFLCLWLDPVGDRTHDLSHAKRALYHYANVPKVIFLDRKSLS